MALATGIRMALLTGMTGSAIMEYSGELHIVLKDTPNDNQKNYIGHIPADEMCLLEHFKSGTAFCFEKE